MNAQTQLPLPGLRAVAVVVKRAANGEITVRYPRDAPIATIAGKWKRLTTGEIQATYTKA